LTCLPLTACPLTLKGLMAYPLECFTAFETLIQHAHALSLPFLTHTY